MAVQRRTELAISCPNRAGELARALETLSKAGVNVLAFCGWGHGEEANILLVPDSDSKAATALRAAKITYEPRTVLCVTSGEGGRLARILADAKINVEYTYASTSGKGESTAIFAVKDVETALKLIG